MRSLTKKMPSRVGMKASRGGRCMRLNGTVTQKAKSNSAATASANRRCPRVGGMFVSKNFDSSDGSTIAKIVSAFEGRVSAAADRLSRVVERTDQQRVNQLAGRIKRIGADDG